jgi:Flp pilus assembly pilin Flp
MSHFAGELRAVVKGAHFQRIVPPKGDEHSETEGQGTMSLLVRLLVGLQPPEFSEAEGQGLVEYALILLLVCIACLAAISSMGDAIVQNLWKVIQDVLIPALGV